jgi:hypothetical protein
MTTIKHLVVATLLAVWCFPAVGLAKPEPASPPPLPALVTSASAPGAAQARAAESAEATQLAAREKQSQNVQDFKGGEGAYIYVGGGALTVVLLIVLLVILL